MATTTYIQGRPEDRLEARTHGYVRVIALWSLVLRRKPKNPEHRSLRLFYVGHEFISDHVIPDYELILIE